MIRPLALLLALCLATAPIDVVHASPQSGAEATLTIDTSEIGGAGPILRTRLLERGGQVFRDGNVMPSHAAGGVEVVVRVQEIGGEEPGFAYEISIHNAGETRASEAQRWTMQCTLCTETELIDSVAAELGKVASTLGVLAARDPEPPVDADTDPEPNPVPGPPGIPAEDAPEPPRRMPVWTRAGIGVAVTGVAGVAAGVGLVVAKPRPLPDNPRRERYTQPPGYALLAIGGAAVVVGAVLIILAAKKRPRRVTLRPGGLRVRM